MFDKVIILIYEYAIAVEWSSVQNIKHPYNGSDNDRPHADKLDRSYFGFDQDYFERMPLLINALQESNYADHSLEVSGALNKKKRFNVTVVKTPLRPILQPSPVKRTSPRPFYFEYRHPTPLPFSKTYTSRSWIEKYRNEERLRNIRQIIKYLENTINAKVGDMYAKPTEKQIAFTGLYVEPMLENKSVENKSKLDLESASSDNLKRFHLNHLADPLFNFKPENPGDVNLLADHFFRFSPLLTHNMLALSDKYPMFRQIPFQNRNCQGNRCEGINGHDKLHRSSSDIKQTETPPVSTTKSFSVVLNLYPITPKTDSSKDSTTTTTPIHKIYLTTSRPVIHFKRKSNVAFRRIYTPYKRPKYLSNLINKATNTNTNTTKEAIVKDNLGSNTQMVVHVQVYDEENRVKNESHNVNSITSIPSTHTNPYTSKAPIEYSTSQIGDYHAGSTGYIPVTTKTDKSLPIVTTMFPFIDTSTEYWNSATSQPTQVMKFDAEDAKVPSQYLNLNNNLKTKNVRGNRRNSGEQLEREPFLLEMQTYPKETQTSTEKMNKLETFSIKSTTLVIKLKNNISQAIAASNETYNIEDREEETTTTPWTYVPQINGHYRSINQNSTPVDKQRQTKPENDRKRRLEMAVSDFQSYSPIYVEIRRNNNHTSHNEEENKKITKH